MKLFNHKRVTLTAALNTFLETPYDPYLLTDLKISNEFISNASDEICVYTFPLTVLHI
jgi:hypothetical protein